MNRPSPSQLAGLLAALIAAPRALPAPVRYEIAAGSKVTFEAASNLHTFNGSTEAVTGNVSFDREVPLDSTGEVVIDADALRTGDRKRDGDMRSRALETGKFPRIVMKMTRFVPSPTLGTSGRLEGNIHGELELHGLAKKLVVPAEIETLADGKLQVTGKVGIDMRNWDIRPPRNKILFVTLQVLPNVTVGFDLGLEPKDDPELAARLERIEQLKVKLQGSD